MLTEERTEIKMSINIHHNGSDWYITQLRYTSNVISSLWYAYREDGASLTNQSLDSLLQKIQSYRK